MHSAGSVSLWLGRLAAGDEAAVRPLWQRYFARLVVLARQRLRGLPGAAVDGEDVALSAFDSFCRAAEQGRFPRLEDRDDLWQVLVLLTARKAVNLLKHERRHKRGGGRVRNASDVAADSEDVLAGVLGREPTPEFAAQVAEECRRLLERLDDDGLRAVALAKMEGHTNAEIAQQLGCAETTVERRLKAIRRLWDEDPERSS